MTTPWKIEDDPEYSVRTLREIAEKPCVEFQERVAAGNKYQFCGRCASCVASQAMLMIHREREAAHGSDKR